MERTADGLIVFARRPCRSGCGHADEAFHPEELARERGSLRSRRTLLPYQEAEIVRLYEPGSARGRKPTNANELAHRFGVSSRTIHRVAKRAGGRAPCPRCPTITPSGRLCTFCRRTEELSSERCTSTARPSSGS